MTELSREQVRSFFTHLRTALYDKHLENKGCELVFFVDADVAVRLIAGMEEFEGTNDRQLVRALMACQFLGRFEMLRPHALELHDYIVWREREEGTGVAGRFFDRIKQFVAETGLQDTLQDILDSAKPIWEKDAQEGSYQYLEALRSGGVQTFAALESAMGPWQRRLRRLYGTVVSAMQPGPEMRQLLAEQGPMVNKAMGVLRTMQKPPYRSIASDYCDACALGALYWLRKKGEREFSRKLVRFYTETGLLQSAMSDPNALATDLSYEAAYIYEPEYVDIAGIGEDERRILREPDYFLMRARFKQLRFGTVGTTQDLDRLIQGVRQRDILSLDDSRLKSALEEFKIEGDKLAEVIAEFEDLSLVRRIWADGAIPEPVLEALPEWSEVVAVLRNERTAEVLSERIDDVKRDLRQKVDHISVWIRDFDVLAKLMRGRRGRQVLAALSGMDRTAAEAVLGMRRWGIALDEERLQRIGRVLGRAGEDEGVDSHRIHQDLASSMDRARERVDEAEYIVAVLWALGGYSKIVEIVEDLSRNGQTLPLSLELVRWAASLRGEVFPVAGKNQWLREWSEVSVSLWKRVEAEEQPLRAELRIGLGYVLFHFALAARRRAPRDGEVELACQEWETRSLELGEAAKMEMAQDSLPWALAVNHCLYVGIETGASDQKIVDNCMLLRDCETRPIWNARFSDTIARYFIWRFNRWKASKELAELQRELREARKYLDSAQEGDLGDIAVAKHEAELHGAEQELLALAEKK